MSSFFSFKSLNKGEATDFTQEILSINDSNLLSFPEIKVYDEFSFEESDPSFSIDSFEFYGLENNQETHNIETSCLRQQSNNHFNQQELNFTENNSMNTIEDIFSSIIENFPKSIFKQGFNDIQKSNLNNELENYFNINGNKPSDFFLCGSGNQDNENVKVTTHSLESQKKSQFLNKNPLKRKRMYCESEVEIKNFKKIRLMTEMEKIDSEKNQAIKIKKISKLKGTCENRKAYAYYQNIKLYAEGFPYPRYNLVRWQNEKIDEVLKTELPEFCNAEFNINIKKNKNRPLKTCIKNNTEKSPYDIGKYVCFYEMSQSREFEEDEPSKFLQEENIIPTNFTEEYTKHALNYMKVII